MNKKELATIIVSAVATGLAYGISVGVSLKMSDGITKYIKNKRALRKIKKASKVINKICENVNS